MVGESPSGIDLLAPVGKVRVLPVLLRPAAGEVLPRAGDARGPRAPLETLEVGQPELGDEVGVLAERAGLAGPPRLRREVERRVEGSADADRDVLLPRDVGERPHGVGVAQRGEAERLGPLREGARGEGDPGVLDEGVPRVGRDRDRDAVGRGLGDRLERVVPPGRQTRGRRATWTLKWVRCLSSTTMRVGDLLIAPGSSRTEPSAPASMTVWNIRPTFSSRREPPEEVVDACLDVEPGVLVGVHPAVAVEVAVGDAVLVVCRTGSPVLPLSRVVPHRRGVRGACRRAQAAHGRRSGGSPGDGAGAELLDADDRAQGRLDVGRAEGAAQHVLAEDVAEAPMTIAWSSER